MMKLNLSRSEIKSEIEKAVRGSGFDWGRAKDAGVMAVWLSMHDQPFLGTVLRCLDELSHQQEGNSPSKYGPVDGMLLSEYVLATQNSWTGHLMGARYLVAGMGVVTQEQNAALALENSNGDVLAYAESGSVSLDASAQFQDAELCLKPADPSRDLGHLNRLECNEGMSDSVSKACWARLNTLAFRVYVPETEEKRRSGAGAGDIDNS